MQYFYHIQTAGSAIAVVAILIGAIIACIRKWTACVILQVIGAIFMVTAAAMGYFLVMKVDPKTGRMDPIWIWHLEQILSFAGLVCFAVGYLIERIVKRRIPT